MYTYRFFHGVVCLLCLLLIVGCSSNDNSRENNELKGRTQGADFSVLSATATVTPALEVNTDTLFAGSSYEILYTQDSTLYYLASATGQPEAIESNVHPASLALAPDHSSMIFGIEKTEMDIQSLGILNLTTMETTTVDLPGDTIYMPPVVHGWSANNEWVILSFSPLNDEVYVVNTLTGDFVRLDWYGEGERPHSLSVFWLTDNTILVYAFREVVDRFGVTLTDVYRFDPVSREFSPIELSEDGVRSLALKLSPSTLATLDKELRDQGLSLSIPRLPSDRTEYYDEMAGAATVEVPNQTSDAQIYSCNDWSIQYKPIQEVGLPRQLYGISNVTLLSDLSLLPDKSLLLSQWKMPTCGQFRPEALTVELLHIQSDDTVEVVASDISYGWVFDFYDLVYSTWPAVARSNLYAASPDGQYVAWVKNDDTVSSLVVTDLENMLSAKMLEVESENPITSIVMLRTGE